MRQLGQMKRQKSGSTGLGAETQTDNVVGLGSSLTQALRSLLLLYYFLLIFPDNEMIQLQAFI
ncbi:hypothetical protein NIES4075_50520 [Tolypothrix sp. NIES-4075]|nr:hypothetical protein NIES4075_50520 [Tolypothrix sp. NIES-4075]